MSKAWDGLIFDDIETEGTWRSEEDATEAIRRFFESRHWWTVRCPLDGGAEAFVTYDIEAGRRIASGVSLPYRTDPFTP